MSRLSIDVLPIFEDRKTFLAETLFHVNLDYL